MAEQVERLYKNLDAWQKTQVARHPARPHCMDYIETLVDDFTPLAGDRLYSEDYAVIAGLGRGRASPLPYWATKKVQTRKTG